MKLKERIERWWYLGDQEKTPKIIAAVVLIWMAIILSQIIPDLLMGFNR